MAAIQDFDVVLTYILMLRSYGMEVWEILTKRDSRSQVIMAALNLDSSIIAEAEKQEMIEITFQDLCNRLKSY